MKFYLALSLLLALILNAAWLVRAEKFNQNEVAAPEDIDAELDQNEVDGHGYRGWWGHRGWDDDGWYGGRWGRHRDRGWRHRYWRDRYWW